MAATELSLESLAPSARYNHLLSGAWSDMAEMPVSRRNKLGQVLRLVFDRQLDELPPDEYAAKVLHGLNNPDATGEVRGLEGEQKLCYQRLSEVRHHCSLRLHHPDTPPETPIYLDLVVKFDDMHRGRRDAALVGWLLTDAAHKKLFEAL